MAFDQPCTPPVEKLLASSSSKKAVDTAFNVSPNVNMVKLKVSGRFNPKFINEEEERIRGGIQNDNNSNERRMGTAQVIRV